MQVNREQPALFAKLSSEYKDSLLFVRTGFDTRDYAKGSNVSSSTSTKVNTRGLLARGYSSGSTKDAYPPTANINKTRSILCIVNVNAFTNYSHIIDCLDTGTTNGFEFRLGSASGSSRLMLQRANATYKQFQASVSNLLSTAERNTVIIVTFPLNIATAPTFFVNGIKYTGVSYSGTGTGDMDQSTNSAYVGARSSGATWLNGNIPLLACFDRELDDSECIELSDNPWRLFKSDFRFSYLLPNVSSGSVKDIAFAITNAVSIALSAKRIRETSVNVTETSAATASINRSRSVSFPLPIASTIAAAINKAGSATINFAVNVTSTIGAVIKRNRSISASTSNAVTITESINRNRALFFPVSIGSTITAAIAKAAQGSIAFAVNVSSTVTGAIKRQRGISAPIAQSLTMTAAFVRVKKAAIAISESIVLQFALYFPTSVVSTLRKFTVAAEQRGYAVAAEQRIYIVSAESRSI